MPGPFWTQEEINYLLKYGPNHKCKDIAKILNKSTKAVQQKYNQLGIKKESLKIGDRCNRLLILDIYRVDNPKTGGYFTMAKCKCDCGNITEIRLTILKAGKIVSCGCYMLDRNGKELIKHGCTPKRLYRIYYAMKSRCYNINTPSYRDYGAKNIKICDEWLENYLNFKDWALKNGYNSKLTLDRIDYHGNYTPENCRWTTTKIQANNKSSNKYITAFNETKTAQQWCEDPRCKISFYGLIYRINHNWSIEQAITTPPLKNKIQGGPNKADTSKIDYSHNKNSRHLHGLSNTRLCNIWNGIKRRCYNTNYYRYNEYGGRGIIICDEWKNDFISFYNWSILNGYHDDLSLDRIDVNGNYAPSNCRWVDTHTQNYNKNNTILLTAFGETKNLCEWANDDRCVIEQKTLYTRIKNKWEHERALITPKYGSN